jgi:cytochrome c
MESLEFNKVAGAILGTCLFTLALNIAAGAVFAPQKPAKPGYDIAVTEQPAGGDKAAAAPAQPIEVLLASASTERGQNSAKACQACHSFEKGGPNKVGPNLWGVVNRPRASEPGFNYSAAMKGKPGNWSFDELNKFLAGPQAYIPGTAMSFAGLTRDTARADVIDYLRTLADSPVPLPKVAEGQAAGPQGGAPNAQKPAAAAPAAPGTAPAPAKPQPGNSGAQPNAPKGQAPKPQ